MSEGKNQPVGASQQRSSKPEVITSAQSALGLLRSRGSITSLELGETLNLLQPPSEIRALRRAGHRISTSMVWQADRDGVSHRCALYRYHGHNPRSRREN